MIISAIQEKKLPVYGNGLQVRDWIYVEDHITALIKISQKGRFGHTYNIGGNNQIKNIIIVRKICTYLAKIQKKKIKKLLNLISYVEDRPGHDKRYAVNTKKIQKEIGWKPTANFDKLLVSTIEWYLTNPKWWQKILKKNYNLSRLGLKK